MPEYHGWTHAPKAQGGTDPIPGAAAGAFPTFFACQNEEVTEVPSGDDSILLFDHWVNGDSSVFEETTMTGPSSGELCVWKLHPLLPGLYAISCSVGWVESPGVGGFTEDRGVGLADGFMDEDWFSQTLLPTSNVMMTSFSIVRSYPGVGIEIGFESPLGAGHQADLIFRAAHKSASSKHTGYPTNFEVNYLGPVDVTE